MARTIELKNAVNPRTVEALYAYAKEIADRPDPQLAMVEQAMRAVRAKDPVLLETLERCANVLDSMAEGQGGQTRRQSSTEFSHRFEPTVVKAFKEAFRSAQDGTPIPHLGYLYAAAAKFQGVIQIGPAPSVGIQRLLGGGAA